MAFGGGFDFASLFGMGGQQQQAQPQQDFMQALQPMGQDEIRRRAIAKALVDFGAKMSSTPGNFGTGLAQSVPAGAGAFLETRQGLEDQNRKRAKEVLDQMLESRKADELDAYRKQQLELKGSQNDMLNAYRTGVLDQGQQKIKQEERRLDLSANDIRRVKDPIDQEIKVREHLRKQYDSMVNPQDVYLNEEQRAQRMVEFGEYERRFRDEVLKGKGDLQPGANQALPGAAQAPQAPVAPQAPAAPTMQGSGPVRVRTPQEAQRLQPGTIFIGPDGKKYQR